MKTAFQLIEEHGLTLHGDIEHFAELVRADERARMAEQPTSPAPAQQLTAWVDAGNLKQLRKGDVIRVIRKGETYYSPFRYCGVLVECDYEHYSENSQFVYLEVGMATVEKIVYTTKDFTTGAIYASRGDMVEVAIEAAHNIKEKNNG